jgi:signal transduction histidine kinase/CheY-like chemotaxis protein
MNDKITQEDNTRYLSPLGAWALAFGCAVGWGAFVMPGGVFLPNAGPVGSAIGMLMGAVVMIILAVNYNYLMQRFADGGGTYTYTKECFGYDHGFLSAWFLVLTCIAVLWANATAIPLIARTLLGPVFQFGFHYRVFSFDVFFGEIIIVLAAVIIAGVICLNKSISQWVQIVCAVLLFALVVIVLAKASAGSSNMLDPAYSPDSSKLGGILTIFSLTPWAFVGFESISHSAHEAKYDLKKNFGIFVAAIIIAALCYIGLIFIASSAQPVGRANWYEYISRLGSYVGKESMPTFHGAYKAMGNTGAFILGLAALCGIFTGLIGNYVALSRLLVVLAKDGIIRGNVADLDRNNVPRKAIIEIMIISLFLPFFGRTAIGWIVDVTTVGGTIAYAFASGAAYKTAKQNGDESIKIFGLLGLAFSFMYAVIFLVPSVLSVTTLSTESYLILSIWSILGFLYFRRVLRNDEKGVYGRSTVAWTVLLGLIIFTSTIWMRQYVTGKIEALSVSSSALDNLQSSFVFAIVVQIVFIAVALLILFNIYSHVQKRERNTEVAKSVAEESSRAKSSFLSKMSHEIRTPLNAIIGLDNIALRDPDLTPKNRETFEKIGASATHLLGLINDILDMSRIESGRVSVKTEEFLLKDLLEQVSIIINGQCQDKGLHFDCNTQSALRDYYVGDDMKIKQILINILGNSVKFTNAPGRVSLSVEEIPGPDGSTALRFTTNDTGIGMDKEFIPHIFESFSMENDGSTSKYGGTGLGMAITKNFIDMMQGTIDVESTKGVGTSFIVTVPVTASERVAAQNTAAAEVAHSEIAGILAGKNVLMAEDVDQNAEILADLLELEDIIPTRAINGENAVDLFKKSEEGFFDAILMDIRMPVMDGLEATRVIRALARSDAKTVPIIAMTANVFDEDIERSLESGMNAHLFKPIDPERMYEKLAEFIKAYRQ